MKAYRVPRPEVWRCLREQGVPEKYVRLMKVTYEDARTQVNTIIGVTPSSKLEPLPVCNDHGCDRTGHQIAAPWYMLFADDSAV